MANFRTFISFMLLINAIHSVPVCVQNEELIPSSDCSGFYQCSNGVAHLKLCPSKTLFDVKSKICNHDFLVTCQGSTDQTITTNKPNTISYLDPTRAQASTTSSTTSTSGTTTKNNTTVVTLPETTSKIISTIASTSEATTGSNRVGLTFKEFSNALILNGYKEPTVEQYNNFVNGAPTQGKITTKRELAMFLAQIVHESGGLVYRMEIRCGSGCVNCPGEYSTPDDAPGQRYCGRGYIQLVSLL